LVRAYHDRASLWAQVCENGRAIEDFTRSITLDPGYGSSYSLRGYLRGLSGQYDLAEQDHQRAIELADRLTWENYLPWVLQHQADLWRRRGEFQRALDICDQAQQHGDYATVTFRRAWIYLDRGDDARAQAEFEKYIARFGRNGESLSNLWPDERIAVDRLQRLDPAPPDPIAPVGVWDITGVDDQNTTWIATLVLTADADHRLAGHIDWIGSNGHCGREFVTGKFDFRSRLLEMTGTDVKHAEFVAPARYRCRFSKDGARLEKGQWLGETIIPGEWHATRIHLP
jgi:tetratricopeptide (TPR) repeat protein